MGCLENDMDMMLSKRREAYKQDHPNATLEEILEKGSIYNGSFMDQVRPFTIAMMSFIQENSTTELAQALTKSLEVRQALVNVVGIPEMDIGKRSVFSYHYDEVMDKINRESAKARSKHGGAPQATEIEALSVLTEEVGEVATSINQNQPKALLEREIIQVASVAIRWLMGDLTFSRKA